MSLTLFAHPLYSYCQKALIALYENGTAFEFRMLAHDDPGAAEALAALWPLRKFPVLVDGERTVAEASIIIEYLGVHHPGPVRLVPADAARAIDVRFMDRFFDNYVMTPQQRIIVDTFRAPDRHDPQGVEEARDMLETSYRWLDARMADREWAAGDGFSLADCAAGPALFYAHWTHRIDDEFRNLHAYRDRLMARPSFARAIDEARPYRHLFPLGVPEQD